MVAKRQQAAKAAMENGAACPFLRVDDFCTQPPLVWMTLPLVGGGDLRRQMKQRKFGEGETIKIMHDAWLALAGSKLRFDLGPVNVSIREHVSFDKA